jgi:integrase/recombinase XerD
MLGETIKIPILARNEIFPYYFSEDEIARFFSVIRNLKHLCIFQTLFSGCLRASELCNLDDADLDIETYTILIREGKGGRDGFAFLTEECARHMKQYLSIRPPFKIDGRQPLFYTDYGKRWRRGGLSKIYYDYKRAAKIEKKGGLHVFARHSPTTLMTAKGVPLNVVQKLLRHKDLRSTLRYAHVDSTVARQWYNKTMRLDF